MKYHCAPLSALLLAFLLQSQGFLFAQSGGVPGIKVIPTPLDYGSLVQMLGNAKKGIFEQEANYYSVANQRARTERLIIDPRAHNFKFVAFDGDEANILYGCAEINGSAYVYSDKQKKWLETIPGQELFLAKGATDQIFFTHHPLIIGLYNQAQVELAAGMKTNNSTLIAEALDAASQANIDNIKNGKFDAAYGDTKVHLDLDPSGMITTCETYKNNLLLENLHNSFVPSASIDIPSSEIVDNLDPRIFTAKAADPSVGIEAIKEQSKRRPVFGFLFAVSSGKIKVLSVMPGSSADQAGLKIGDEIDGIGGVDISTMDQMALTKLFAGETSVALNVKDPGGIRSIKIEKR
jgi:hypothetical protein